MLNKLTVPGCQNVVVSKTPGQKGHDLHYHNGFKDVRWPLKRRGTPWCLPSGENPYTVFYFTVKSRQKGDGKRMEEPSKIKSSLRFTNLYYAVILQGALWCCHEASFFKTTVQLCLSCWNPFPELSP